MLDNDEATKEERNRGSKENMNKRSDISTISVNRHEKMGAFESQSLLQPTSTEAEVKRTYIYVHIYICMYIVFVYT